MDQKRDVNGLNFQVELSMRYHQRRRAYFERLHRLFMFGIILSGSATMADLNAYAAGAATTILGASDLVIGFSAKARDHQVLFERFSDLSRRILKSPEPTQDEIAEWRDAKLAIDSQEPPVYRALEADCYNEVCRAWGVESAHAPALTLAQRLLMHWWRFEDSEFPPRKATNTPAAA